MTRDEATAMLSKMDGLGTVFVKVWAKATAGNERVTEFRFPGVTVTGYIIATPLDVIGWSDWLDIERVEKW